MTSGRVGVHIPLINGPMRTKRGTVFISLPLANTYVCMCVCVFNICQGGFVSLMAMEGQVFTLSPFSFRGSTKKQVASSLTKDWQCNQALIS